jgi:hypothetical protein
LACFVFTFAAVHTKLSAYRFNHTSTRIFQRMDRAELLRLARYGAEARIAELQNEIDAIRRRFPHLRGGRGRAASSSANQADAGAGETGTPARKPRQMSAAARRRISQAAKLRWRKWRKEKGR